MDALEAIAKIREIIGDDSESFYDDEKRQLDESVSCLTRHFRGKPLDQKCAELKMHIDQIKSPAKLRRTPGSHQVRVWIAGSLSTLEDALVEVN